VSARIAYSGEPGAFAEDAVRAIFGEIERVGLPGFRQVFTDVSSGASVAGVVPIENLVHGTVRENLDLLLEHDLEIRAEVVVPVQLCLAALPGERLDGIERVYSHVQALGQAEAFLRQRPWTLLTTYNTAGAGKLIVDRGERGSAAVLSPRAAALFGLEILADGIQDVAANRTRFLLLVRPGAPVPPTAAGGASAAGGSSAAAFEAADAAEAADAGRAMRTTLVIAVRNEPGTLLRVLDVFARRNLNMSTIESRPSRERAWEYVFWVDLDADAADPATQAALDEVRAATTMTRILGSYPRASEA
jgi:prephenate dehydratase